MGLHIHYWLAMPDRRASTVESRFGKIILWVLVLSLLLSDVSNVFCMADEKNKPHWFFCVDLFWPFSNICMLIAGVVVSKAKVLQGWHRFVPLIVGLWNSKHYPIRQSFRFTNSFPDSI